MQTQSFLPHAALGELVSGIHTIDLCLPVSLTDVVSPFPPSPFQSLMFYCNDPVSLGRPGSDEFSLQPLVVFNGPQLSRVNIQVHRRLRSVRVDFLPGAMHRLLGLPMHQLVDAGWDAFDFFGPGMRSLHEQLQETSDLREAKTLVENFLLKRLHNTAQYRPFDAAIGVLLTSGGLMSVEKIASLACSSLKQFERHCQDRIGMNPKLFARIVRFSNAYRLREGNPALSWLQIAHSSGYYDQMHLVRDFKVFAGVTPVNISRQLGATPIRMQQDMRV